MSIALVVAVVLTGCSTGQRPTLTSEPYVTDSAVEAVIGLMSNEPTTFTARYRITPTTSGADAVDATVTRQPDRLRVTIGEVNFLTNAVASDPGTYTCASGLSNCYTGTLDGYVSDLNITSEFWSQATKQRLATDANRNIGPSTPSSPEIADQPATCATLTMSGGKVEYCATAAGILARYVGADTRIELTSYEATVDPAALAVTLNGPIQDAPTGLIQPTTTP